MPQHDWVLGTDRNTEALARILSASSELVSRKGFEAFTVEAVAAELHCSPATVYRRAGGKAAILERLVSLFAERIVGSIREAITGLGGTDTMTIVRVGEV